MFFERESACAPANTVFLNVYDLASMASIPNAILCNSLVKTFGAFHVAVEVYGEEWGFYRQMDPDECGICRSRTPRRHPVHIYRQSVNLGATNFEDWQVWDLMRRDLIPQWPGGRYDLIHGNCIHFSQTFSNLLQVNPVPSWVTGLHETGAAAAALLKVPWPLSLLTGAGQQGAIADAGAARGSGDTSAGSGEDRPCSTAGSATGSGGAAAAAAAPARPDFLPKPLADGDGGGSSSFRRIQAREESRMRARGDLSPQSARSAQSFSSVADECFQSPQR
mmetsp:Transcript_18133/g.47876  ORF Transcript_18133/g.47876 Transcript_18133/m.47876 type:complete len:278 (-) Transcript_18133:309-1142(-)